MKYSFTKVAFVLLTIAIFSCSKEEETFLIEESLPVEKQKMILDESGYNPYTPDMMQLALDSLKSKVFQNFPEARVTTEEIELDLTPNNMYMRFLPSDSLEYDSLMSYENLSFFEYPIDLPILQTGEYEPDYTNDNGYSWEYVVVPLDFIIPSHIENEIISEVFLPEYPNSELNEDHLSTARITNSITDSTENLGLLMGVELYSLYLSGHLSEEEADQYIALLEGDETVFEDPETSNARKSNTWDSLIKGLKAVKNTLGSVFITPAYAKKANPVRWCWTCVWNKSWTPKGTIRFRYNDGTRNLTKPVKGMRVIISYSLRSSNVYTDSRGGFRSNKKFGTSVNYTTVFENSNNFKIKRQYGFKTYTTNLKVNTRQQNFTYTFNLSDNNQRVDDRRELAASTYMAAEHYYNGNIFGLTRPQKHLGIRIIMGSGRPNHSVWRYLVPLGDPVHIYWRRENSNVRTVQSVMAGTIHELAHAGHLSLSTYPNTVLSEKDEIEILKESWANYVEHRVTRLWFPNHDLSRQNRTFTDFNNNNEGKYTSLFFDLEDTFDQSRNNTVPDMPIDLIDGYTINQMERALKDASTLTELMQNLKNQNAKTGEGNLDALILSYKNNLNPS